MKRLILMVIFGLLLTLPVFAGDVSDEESSAYGIPELEAQAPSQVSEVLGELSVSEAADAGGLLGKVWDYAAERLGGIIKAGAKSAGTVLVIVLLCSVVSSIWEPEQTPDAISLGGVACVAAVSVGDMNAFIGLGRETLATLADFSTLLLPCLSTAAAAGGAISSAAAKYAATALFMDGLLSLANGLVLPLIMAYTAAAIASAAVGGDALASVQGLIKWLCVSLMSLLMIAFTAYLALTGVVAGSADAVTTRLTKTAIQTVLPVVGSIVSDAAGTVAAGAGMIRNCIGIFGMLAVLCVCLLPFLRLGAQYLMYKAAAGLSGALCSSRLAKLISDIGTAFGMLMALIGAGALMLFFSIFSIIKAVSGA